MARNRMINPEFWLDEELAELSAFARLLYIGLWGICDDNYATLPNRPKWIKAQVFPYNDVNTPQLLTELSEAGKLVLFTDENGDEYYYIKNFLKHQRVEKPSKPKYPQFDENRVILPDSSPNTPAEVKLSKEKITGETANAAQKREYGNPEINEGIDLLRELFGSISNMQKNRYALKRLYAAKSKDRVLKAMRFSYDNREEKYCPSITNYLDLEEKWEKLENFARRMKKQQEEDENVEYLEDIIAAETTEEQWERTYVKAGIKRT